MTSLGQCQLWTETLGLLEAADDFFGVCLKMVRLVPVFSQWANGFADHYHHDPVLKNGYFIGNKPNGFADHYPYEKLLFHWEDEPNIFRQTHLVALKLCGEIVGSKGPPLLRQAMSSEMGFVAVQAFNASISATESCWRSLVQISSNHC